MTEQMPSGDFRADRGTNRLGPVGLAFAGVGRPQVEKWASRSSWGLRPDGGPLPLVSQAKRRL